MADALPCSIQRRRKVNVPLTNNHRSPVRIRLPAPKRKTAAGRFSFLLSLSGVEVYARRVNPATSSKSDRILSNTVTFITF